MSQPRSTLVGVILAKATRSRHGETSRLSASPDVCPQFPGFEGHRWVRATMAERHAHCRLLGLPPERYEEIANWTDENFESLYGWPSVFYTIEAAKAARDRFFASDRSMHVLAIGMSDADAAEFIESQADLLKESAEIGPSGLYQLASKGVRMPPLGRELGFELIEIGVFDLGESWSCQHGLIEECVRATGIRHPADGISCDYDSLEQCRHHMEETNIATEEGPWWTLRLVDCT